MPAEHYVILAWRRHVENAEGVIMMITASRDSSAHLMARDSYLEEYGLPSSTHVNTKVLLKTEHETVARKYYESVRERIENEVREGLH